MSVTTQTVTPSTLPGGTAISTTRADGGLVQVVQLDVATVPVSIAATVNVSNGQTQPLTDTQLRATAVPVSGTFFQGTQPISGTVTASQPVNTTASGTFTAADAVVAAPDGTGTLVSGASTAGSIVSLVIPDGFTAWTVLVKGWANGTVYSEASFNSTNGTDGDWVEVKGRRTGTAPGTESVVYAFVANGYYRGNGAGFTRYRLRFLGGATFPTVSVVLSKAMGATFLNSGLPAGSSSIGTVVLGAGAAAVGGVTVSNFPATQAVSLATAPSTPVTNVGTFATQSTLAAETTKVIGTVNVSAGQSVGVTQATGTNLHVVVDSAPTTAVTLATNTPDVTDRSARLLGTIANTAFTANAGTNLNTSALALDATLTGGTQKAIARTAAKGTAVAADLTSNPVDANTQALHVNLAGTNAVNATLGAETTKVIGTVNLSAAQTLATVTTLTGITNALPTGANTIGTVLPKASDLVVTTLSVSATTVTATLPAVASQFHYITRIEIVRVSTAAVTGSAVLGYTSTNLPGSWARSAGNAIAIGATVFDVNESMASPLKSSVVNTATTIVAPSGGTGVQVRITVYYYTAA